MDCDRVFDILTRGPFPTGDVTDGAVEAHILRCPSCRRLAEALRPADDVEQESVTTEESLALPGYWSDLSSAGGDPVVSLGRPLRLSASRKQMIPQPSLKPRRLMPVISAIIALSLIFAAIGWALVATFFFR